MLSILRLVSAASPEGFAEELATASPRPLPFAVPWEPPSATNWLSFFSPCFPLRWKGSLTFRVDGAGPSSFLQFDSNCEIRAARYPRDRRSCFAWSRLQPEALQFATRLDGFALGAMLVNQNNSKLKAIETTLNVRTHPQDAEDAKRLGTPSQHVFTSFRLSRHGLECYALLLLLHSRLKSATSRPNSHDCCSKGRAVRYESHAGVL